MTKNAKYLLLVPIMGAILTQSASARLQHHWRLDDGKGTVAIDSSNIWSNGILDGNPVWKPNDGIDNRGAIELGINDRVFSAVPVTLGNSFTVMAWVKPSGAQAQWARLFTSSYVNGFMLGTDNTGSWIFITPGMTPWLPGGTVIAGQWQHIVGVYDGNSHEARLYVNGVAYGPRTGVTGPTLLTQKVYIGQENGFDASVKGLVDDVAIFDTALSPSEIQAIFADGFGGKSLNYWQAINLSPADFAENQPLDVALTWSMGLNPPRPITNHILYYGPNYYDVYYSDPNSGAVGTVTEVVLPVGITSYAPGFANDTTYYWRIDEEIDSNTIARGDIWHFATIKLLAQITQQPRNQRAFEGQGESVTFMVTATSDSPMSYQWYKDGNPVGTNSNQLTIQNVIATDAGEYYVEITNAAGVQRSDSAYLILKKLIGYWPLDGNPNDASGYGNDGIIKHTVQDPNYIAGFIGSGAAKFNSSEKDYLEIPNEDHFDYYDELTVSYWMNANISNNSQSLWATTISKGGNNGGWDINRFDWTDLISVHIDANPDTLNNDTYTWWANDPSVFDSNWHLVTFVVNHDTESIYVDGEIRQTDLFPSMVASEFNIHLGCWIGKDTAGALYKDFFYEGLLDDVRIYNYALSARDIAQLYYDGTAIPVCVSRRAGDINGDCVIDLDDLAILASGWLNCGLFPFCP